MVLDLSEKVAIITGGAGVLGGAMAEGLAAAGARLVLIGRTPEKLEAKAERLQALGAEVLPVVASVLDRTALQVASQQILERWGQINILINCAGGNKRGATILPEQSIFDLSLDAFGQVTQLNLQGTLLPILVFGKAMARTGKGCIINISSMAAQRPLTRVVGYAAAKASIDNLTKWLAVELAQKYGAGIRVNAIAPGFFVGEQNRQLLLNEDGSLTARGQTIVAHTPMKRFGTPQELCGVVNWLCSDGASFVTGAVIPIDGGFGAYSGV
ncbi:MAG: SDR family oxidoreductase [Bacteroidota bacterium]